jgi:hypothetical protein
MNDEPREENEPQDPKTGDDTSQGSTSGDDTPKAPGSADDTPTEDGKPLASATGGLAGALEGKTWILALVGLAVVVVGLVFLLPGDEDAPVAEVGRGAQSLALDADTREASVGETTEVRATLTDSDSRPVPAAEVSFVVQTEGASLDVSQVTTDSRGEATASLTLSTEPGPNRVVASLADVSDELTIMGRPGAPARLDVKAEPQHTLSGGSSTLTARATDEYGNPIEGLEVQFAARTSGASLDVESARTGPEGEATAVLTTSGQAGANSVDVSTEGLSPTSLRVHGGRLSRVTVEPAVAEVVSGASREFEAMGYDERGRAIAIEPRWSVTGGIGTITDEGAFTGVVAAQGSAVATLRGVTGTAEVAVVPGALTTVTVSPAEVALTTGEERRFQCTGTDAAGNEVAVDPEWSLSEGLGTISSQGVYTAGAVGEEAVRAAVEGLTGEALVDVTAGALATVRIEPGEVRLEAGDTQIFTVTGLDSAGNEVPLEPTWTVSHGVGEVDAEGEFTAMRSGTGELVAVSENLAARARIEVTPAELTRIVVTPESTEVPSGTSQRFTATGRDRFDNELEVTPSWNVTGGIGAIDGTGLFTGVTAGEGEVVATSGSVAGKARLEVVPGDVVRLEIAPEEAVVEAGSTQVFETTAFDAAGNIQTAPTRWTVEGGIGSVDASGAFRAEVAGEGQVVGRQGDVSVTADVTVRPSELVTISVSPDSRSLESGSRQTFSATGEDAHGNEVSIEPTWTVTGGIGEIEPTTGEFDAVAVGQGTVVATVGPLGGRAEVRVTAGPLATIEVSAPGDAVTSGQTVRFEALGRDQNGNRVPVSPAWTVTEGLGTIDTTGLFTAQAAGEGKVVATVGSIAGSTDVVVEPGVLASLDIAPEEISLRSGETHLFSVVGRDAFGNAVDTEPAWRVEGPAGSIDSRGRFTARLAGTATVVATSGSLTDESRITVTAGEVASITVAPATVEVTVGRQRQFQATGRDDNGNEVDIEPAWSVTSGIGSIDSSGLFEATQPGQGQVLATWEGIVGTADVVTAPGGLARLRVRPADVTLESGSTRQFEVEGLDANDNVLDDVAVSWSLSGGVGSIGEETGLFTAVTAGKGEVSASSGSIEGSVAVEVVPGEPSLDNSTVSVSPLSLPADGETAALVTVELRDSFNNPVPDVEVTVTSSRGEDSVQAPGGATDESGVATSRVSSEAAGESVLSVTAGGLTLETERLTFTPE